MNSPLEVIIPLFLLALIIFGSYKLGVLTEKMRAKGISIWKWSNLFKMHPEEK